MAFKSNILFPDIVFVKHRRFDIAGSNCWFHSTYAHTATPHCMYPSRTIALMTGPPSWKWHSDLWIPTSLWSLFLSGLHWHFNVCEDTSSQVDSEDYAPEFGCCFNDMSCIAGLSLPVAVHPGWYQSSYLLMQFVMKDDSKHTLQAAAAATLDTQCLAERG